MHVESMYHQLHADIGLTLTLADIRGGNIVFFIGRENIDHSYLNVNATEFCLQAKWSCGGVLPW